jgi:hypothetical protein
MSVPAARSPRARGPRCPVRPPPSPRPQGRVARCPSPRPRRLPSSQTRVHRLHALLFRIRGIGAQNHPPQIRPVEPAQPHFFQRELRQTKAAFAIRGELRLAHGWVAKQHRHGGSATPQPARWRLSFRFANGRPRKGERCCSHKRNDRGRYKTSRSKHRKSGAARCTRPGRPRLKTKGPTRVCPCVSTLPSISRIIIGAEHVALRATVRPRSAAPRSIPPALEAVHSQRFKRWP